jgi:Ca-activated chloride channel family protein
MGDEFDDLRAAFDRATPRPDPGVKAAHLRAAVENFTRHQESVTRARPTPESRPAVGWLSKGLNAVIRTLTPLKATLATTTALVAVGLVMVIPETRELLAPPQQPDTTSTSELGPLSVDGDTPADSLARTEADDGSLASERRDGPEPLEQEAAEAKVAAPDPAPEAGPSDSPMAASPGIVAGGVAGATPEAPSRPAARTRGADAALGGQGAGAVPGMADEAVAAPPPSEGFAAGIVAPATAPAPELAPMPDPNTETFSNEAPNPVKVAAEEPVSTFSIDVDTASWGVVRSSLMQGYLPSPDAVRVEEMVNYFPYAYPAPDGDRPFGSTVTVMPTPWNPGTRLVTIGLQGRLPAVEARPPLNLVFLIDVSGSMEDPNKLPLLRQSFRLMLNELRPEDEVAIVTYAGAAGLVLEPTPASDKAALSAALDRLSAGGSTAGAEGLAQAYEVAESMAADGEVSRVLLATDGDFNVGISDPEELKRFVEARRDSGTYLSVLGFGRGNLDDATMQALAQNGNGTAAYIDTLSEARKVLVDELTGALFPIADDVKIQVEWNPAAVAEYRLIGYETRALRREDFNNDAVDAGEIGAGTAVTAIYEVTPVGSDAVLNDPLRYGNAVAASGEATELGFLRLRYKAPGADTSQLIETPIPVTATEGGEDARFAAAIAGFGQLLRGSAYLGDWSYADAIAFANGARGTDEYGYRTEAVTLMRLAEGLSRN